MKIHCLLHTENPGDTFFPEWAALHEHGWESSIVPLVPDLPHPQEVDCLLVLGGPMSAWEDQRYPWLRREKRYIEAFIDTGKPLLGVCLGAQILADVLGARTYPGPHQEIGWHCAEATPEGRDTWLGDLLPARFETFFWHGDTFELPDSSVRIASSAAFPNQGFVWNQVLGLQFHLEVKPEWVQMLVRRDAEQLRPAAYVQTANTVLSKPESLYRENNILMNGLLNRWLASVGLLGDG
jgi:GMP synthase (glutamine-hydrolysing)